jgi:hypothetical protein
MRAVVVLGLVAALVPAVAGAQSEDAKATASGKRLAKENYIEQAKQRAAKRFDKLDMNHDGVLSPEERRATRRKKPSQE